MHEKNLRTQTNDSGNPLTIQDLSFEFAEMSEEDLQLVVGGVRVNLPIIREGLESAIVSLDNGELIPSKNPGVFIVTGAQSNENNSLLSHNNLIFSGGAIEP
jgi:hypothetical protein